MNDDLNALYEAATISEPAIGEPATDDTLHAEAMKWMEAYERAQERLEAMKQGPDGEALARLTDAQNEIARYEVELKKAVKAAGRSVQGARFEAVLQERKQAPTIDWHIEAIKREPWAAAVLIEAVDKPTFDLMVKSGRITQPDAYQTVTPGAVIKAVTVKERTI
jgi:hypothetical protein